TLRAGAIAVPVNIKLGADQLAYIADHSESVAMIGQREFVDSLPAYQRTFVVGDDYDDAVALMDSGFDSAVVAETDEALLMYTSGTPARFNLLLAQREALGRYDVSSIELLECGSAPVPEELMRAIKETFGCEVCETYGLTEGGANVISPRWGIKKLGSTGLPVPGVEIRIADLEDETRDCEPGAVGELWSRSGANA